MSQKFLNYVEIMVLGFRLKNIMGYWRQKMKINSVEWDKKPLFSSQIGTKLRNNGK